ncbi:LysR family transcriptional regulator [Mesorhizobium sp. ORM8.1]
MNWNDIRFFLAVARHGGLTGAAREVRASPSTVARRIETLEAALHTRLFERRPDGYALTKAGHDMVDKAAALETGMTELENRFSEQDGRVSGTVRIVTVESLAHHLIMPRLSAFQDAYPDLSIGVAINASFASLPQREADVGLRLCRPEHGSFAVKRIGTIAFGLYGSPDYLTKHPIEQDALPIVGHRLITWGDPLSFMALPKALRSWAEGGSTVLQVDSMQAQMMAIKSGSGLGVLPCIAATGQTGLERIKPALCRHDEPIWLVAHEDIRQTRRVRLVCDFLETTVKDMQPALA